MASRPPTQNEHSRQGHAGPGKITPYLLHRRLGLTMTRVAIIEDDLPTSNQLKDWILAARPGITVDQWFNPGRRRGRHRPRRLRRPGHSGHRVGPRAARRRCRHQCHQQSWARHAGPGGLGHAGGHLPQHHEGPGRLGLPPEDRLPKKPTIETFLESCAPRATNQAPRMRYRPATNSPRPLRQAAPLWRGKRVNLPLTAQCILAAPV